MKTAYPVDNFINALVCNETTIDKDHDWFAPFVGDWSFEYTDGAGGGRKVEGEWFFRRVLEGKGIQDIFICPSRSSRAENPQPDGEYGISLRIFNEAERCYDMLYTCVKYSRNLKFKLENGVLTGTLINDPSEKWRFIEISENRFTWQNTSITADGKTVINCEVKAKRI